ncbi:MAG: FKBP-type peptidyl-prolyl cis-trans isomerase, partial [Rickettsiales bacterium]
GQVIPALERGVMGMLVGGERRIVSQPALAYGAPGFNHPVLGDTDYVGFHATLDAVMAGPAAPESEGVLKTYDDEEGKGPLAQCTDRVLIGVAAQDAAGQPLWEGMREATVLLGSGEIAYAIEQAAIGMRAGGKRTVIAPPEFLLPLSVVSVGEQDEKPSNPFPELTGQSQMVILEVRVYPSMATYKP